MIYESIWRSSDYLSQWKMKVILEVFFFCATASMQKVIKWKHNKVKIVKGKEDYCVIVTWFWVKGTVVNVSLQLVLISAWFTEIYSDCWTYIMHESVYMNLGHHVCPCRNTSTNSIQLHLLDFPFTFREVFYSVSYVNTLCKALNTSIEKYLSVKILGHPVTVVIIILKSNGNYFLSDFLFLLRICGSVHSFGFSHICLLDKVKNEPSLQSALWRAQKY